MMAVDMAHDTDLDVDLNIMALTVWAEARGESHLGQRAVAWVIRNRFEHPGWWSKAKGIPANSIAAVCRCPWQFSCWNANDPNRARLDDPATRRRVDYQAIYAVCVDVLSAPPLEDPTDGADHYHTILRPEGVKTWPPVWAQKKVGKRIGSQLFYRLGLDGR